MLETYDIVVFGGTSAGIIAAITALRLDKSVLIISTQKHLGGMTSNGLGWIDLKDCRVVGGIAKEFFKRLHTYYSDDSAWKWEPKRDIAGQLMTFDKKNDTYWVTEPNVAEKTFTDMLNEASTANHKFDIIFDSLWDRNPVTMSNGTITDVLLNSGKRVYGKMFIDCSYEGDLFSKCNIKYIVGRESKTVYDEKWNGVFPDAPSHKRIQTDIDPFVAKGNENLSLLPRISKDIPESGSGDTKVQSYGYRLCLTDVEENRLPITKPENYNEFDYEILLRAIEAGTPADNILKLNLVPNRKTDGNNSGPISIDYVGMNYSYIESNEEKRQETRKAHLYYTWGVLYTLQNSKRVPQEMRNHFLPWGLAKDEFVDNNGWPHELYIREGRRMVSEYVITEHTCLSSDVQKDCIGLAFYNMDSHIVQYFKNDSNKLETDGGMYQFVPVPIKLSYKAIVPPKETCKNILIPVCLSASHVGYGPIRMEPTFMVLGQSAATAACLCIDKKCVVQDLPYSDLQSRLLDDKQILEMPEMYKKRLVMPTL